MSELELTVSRKIAASREKIFNAWLSPTALAKFMKTPAGNFDARDVTTDPVKGGRFMIVMVTPEREIPHSGTYLEVDPYSRLSFTWESPHSLDDSVVTIDLKEIDAETTELTLKQVKFRSEGARDDHIQGWTSILGELDKYLG